MNYWINTVSRDHVLTGVAGGFTQANHGSPHNLKRMKRGDWLVFYSPKTKFKDGQPLQCFTAIGQIVDDAPFQVEMHPGFKPYRRQVQFYDCEEAPIRPMINSLDFIKDKQKWGYPFRRGLFKIEKGDFLHIADAMNVNPDLLE
jgi:hypothetical protein